MTAKVKLTESINGFIRHVRPGLMTGDKSVRQTTEKALTIVCATLGGRSIPWKSFSEFGKLTKDEQSKLRAYYSRARKAVAIARKENPDILSQWKEGKYTTTASTVIRSAETLEEMVRRVGKMVAREVSRFGSGEESIKAIVNVAMNNLRVDVVEDDAIAEAFARFVK